MLCRKLIGAWVLPPLQGLTSFLWPTRAKACALFSWPFEPLSAFVRLRPPMMGLSTEQAESVKRQEIERIPLGCRGHPNDVSRPQLESRKTRTQSKSDCAKPTTFPDRWQKAGDHHDTAPGLYNIGCNHRCSHACTLHSHSSCRCVVIGMCESD